LTIGNFDVCNGTYLVPLNRQQDGPNQFQSFGYRLRLQVIVTHSKQQIGLSEQFVRLVRSNSLSEWFVRLIFVRLVCPNSLSEWFVRLIFVRSVVRTVCPNGLSEGFLSGRFVRIIIYTPQYCFFLSNSKFY
jgi:hypothetical protein